MKEDNVRYCQICGEAFIPNRPWQKYCKKEKCKKIAKSRNVTKWRKKKRKQLYLQNITLEEFRSQEPYKTIYENLIKIQKKEKKIYLTKKENKGKTRYTTFSGNELCRKLGIGDRFICGWYLKAFVRLGVLGHKKGKYFLTKRYEFESLRSRQRDIITTTDTTCILYRPMGVHSFFYYTPHCEINALRKNVEKSEVKLRKVEKLLTKAHDAFIDILREARKNFMTEYWAKNVLNKMGMHILAKFFYGLDLIIKLNELDLIIVSPPEPSLNDQIDNIESIFQKAFNQFLKNRYPQANEDIIEKLHQTIKNSYKKYHSLLDILRKDLKDYYSPVMFDHLLVVDCPLLDFERADEFAALGLFRDVLLYRAEQSKSTITKLKGSERTHRYDTLGDQKPQISYDKKLCIKAPFFKDFFTDFEKDLMDIGFKPGDGYGSIEDYYKNLDDLTETIFIPILPKDFNMLL